MKSKLDVLSQINHYFSLTKYDERKYNIFFLRINNNDIFLFRIFLIFTSNLQVVCIYVP